MLFSKKTTPAPVAAPSQPPEGVDSINQDSNGNQDVEKNTTLADTEKPFEASDNVQAGVRKIEAITSVWGKSHVIAAYVM